MKIREKSAKIIQKQAKIMIVMLFYEKNRNFKKFVQKFVFKTIIFALNPLLLTKTKKIGLPMIKEEQSSSNTTNPFDFWPIIKIQSFIRMFLSRKKFLQQKSSSIILQKHIRKFLSIKKLRIQARCARKIQNFIKKKLRLY